jgi:predicted permease
MGDLKLSVRHLLKTPGFTSAAILVLALGIGLNAAMFSVVYAFALAGRAYADPDRVVQLYVRDARATGGYRPFSYPVYQELAAGSEMFSGMLAHSPTIVGIGDGVESRRALAAVVSADYFDVLGVPLLRGRTFSEQEARPGADLPVVVVSYGQWQRRGFDPGLVGETIRVNERPYTVIGITPRGFSGTMSVVGPELFFPFGVFHTLATEYLDGPARSLQRADAYNLFLVARLKDGVRLNTAASGLELFGQSLARSFPAEHQHHILSLAPLPKFGTSTSPSDERVLSTLGAVMMGMTTAVLLTVCLNLASMLLARGRARRKEFAVRLAIGGGRARIVRQLLVEGLLLSIVGGGFGVALGLYAVDALMASLSAILPISIAIDGAAPPVLVLGAAGFCLLATLLFALGPALRHSRADILSDLKAQTGDDPVPRHWRFMPRNPLVAAQVALSLCLLIAAALFFRMALGSANTEFGFRADDTVLAEVDAQLGGLDETQGLAAYARLEERLSALPGVMSASVGALVPLGMINLSKDVQRAGIAVPPGAKPSAPEAGQAFDARLNAIGARYFDAMGVSLLRGRTFTTAETFGRGATRVVILDDVLAHKLWPDGTALGQHVQWAAGSGEREPSAPMEVVGIVAMTRTGLFEGEPGGAVYVPLAQEFSSNVFFHVRPARPDPALVDAVRREIRATAPGMPLFGVRTFATHVEAAAEYWMLRLSTLLFAFFGVMAMVVALVGIYGVTSYSVARRTREIGVRMAVGARPEAVLQMIVSESLGTAVGGVAVGWLLGLGVGRVMSSVFVDVAAFEPWTFALVPAGFVLAALAAAWGPGRRATQISPMIALRIE